MSAQEIYNKPDEAARYYLLNDHTSPLNDIMHQVSLKVEMQYHKDIERAFEAGAEWQKQQMMKDAVEGTVKYEIGSAEIPQCDRRYQVLSDPTPITNAKLGDKVKILIVKPNNNEQDCRKKGFGGISNSILP